MSLDDRAFSWGFDSPSAGVLVSIDGRAKRVVSDTMFIGPRNGHQARFVEATSEIDKIVGSNQWVECEDPCWQ